MLDVEVVEFWKVDLKMMRSWKCLMWSSGRVEGGAEDDEELEARATRDARKWRDRPMPLNIKSDRKAESYTKHTPHLTRYDCNHMWSHVR